MASVYDKADKWYIRYKDARGKWRDKVCAARTKTEAKRLAGELERQCERQRLGLEPLPAEDGGGTFDELMQWWLDTYSAGSPSHKRNKFSVEKNLIGSELGSLRLVHVTRRGELLGLRKSDVDLSAGLITIARSHAQGTTKGKRAEAIPIARELVPYLQQAVKRSTSELVFPNQKGEMMRPDVALEGVLRRALARAGIVQGYTHVCRKKDCGHTEPAPDAVQRRCPEHKHLLWPKAQVRPLRFHDLRHTTASLLMMAGANPAAVQRILRHRDPRITMEVYGHLTPGYLQAEVDRLQFGLPIPDAVAADEVAEQKLAANAESDPFAAPVLQSTEETLSASSVDPADLESIPHATLARPIGFEPMTYGSGASVKGSSSGSGDSQALAIVRVGTQGRVHRSHDFAANRTRLVTPLLQAAMLADGGKGEKDAPHMRALTVKEVAAILRVSTATVYAMVERGELLHVRVRNAIRVVVARPEKQPAVGSHGEPEP